MRMIVITHIMCESETNNTQIDVSKGRWRSKASHLILTGTKGLSSHILAIVLTTRQQSMGDRRGKGFG